MPPALADCLRQRKIAPWIETQGDGSERLHMPVGVLPYDESYSDIQARLRFMDEHRIATQVLSFPGLFGLDTRPAAEAMPLLELYNDATAAVVKAYPGRFIGLASLPLADLDLAAQVYRRARRDLGMSGAILSNNFFTSLQHAALLRPLLTAANDEGGHIFIHPGRRPDEVEAMDAAGTDRYVDNIMARRQLEIQHDVAQAMVTLLWGDLLDGLNDITLHIANIGGTLPLVIERMDQNVKLRAPEPILPSARLRNSQIYVDCSSMGPDAITAAVRCYGADGVLFGSDCPIYRSDWTLAAVHDAAISTADKQLLLNGNAEILQKAW